MDAARNILEMIKGINVSSNTTLQDAMLTDIKSANQGMIYGLRLLVHHATSLTAAFVSAWKPDFNRWFRNKPLQIPVEIAHQWNFSNSRSGAPIDMGRAILA